MNKVKVTMNLSNMLKAKSKQNKKENETCQQSCWRDQGELIHKKKKKKNAKELQFGKIQENIQTNLS